MTKTDWTAEEVRATVKKIKGHAMTVEERADMFDIADAYAERIAADESAVPVAYSIRWASDSRLNLSTVFDTEQEAHEWVEKCSGDGEIVSLFTHPPAQPAQEKPGWKLDKPARVGGTTFGKGLPWETVIGAAQREYERKPLTPEQIAKLREMFPKTPPKEK